MSARATYIVCLMVALMCTGAAPASAAPQVCRVLMDLEGFEADLGGVRSGRLKASKVLLRVQHVERAFHDRLISDFFSEAPKKQFELYTAALAGRLKESNPSDHKMNSKLKLSVEASSWLGQAIQKHKCRMKPNAQLATDLGQSGSGNMSSQTKQKPTDQTSGVGMVALSVGSVLAVIILLLVVWRSRAASKANNLHGCNTRALLTFGNNCTVTYVSHIGRRRAKLQAPSMDVSAKDLEIYVAGQHIPAKQEWANRYFIGLSFVEPISDEAVTDIIAGSRERDQLAQIGTNATACFFPGCHTNCPKHRATEVSLKSAGEAQG